VVQALPAHLLRAHPTEVKSERGATVSRCAGLLARPVEEGWSQGATTRL